MLKSRRAKATAFVLLIAVIAIGGVAAVLAEKQNILDYLALVGYKPPKEIATLATEDGMTSYTRKVFYVNHPKIESKTVFAKFCPNNSEQTVVLGCYHPNQKGIYLLSVKAPELYGLEQVTAAYETLHAIYQRLSPSAEKSLNSQLLSFEKHGLDNSTVEAQIAGFRKTEPGAVLNEMTSLFATEVQNLPPALNAFYSQYFTSRQTLLNYYNDYQTVFTTRQQQITDYDSQLTALDSQIKADQTELNSDISTIDSQQSTLSQEKSNGQISSYDAAVPSYNQQVDQYNALAQTLSALVSQYNQLVAQRNSLVLEEQQLIKDISSSPQPTATSD